MCCSLLTGCNTEETFGKTGTGILKIGQDAFNTGETGPFGEDPEIHEAQSNEEEGVYYDYNVKKVEKAPKEEKISYNYCGPENNGISSGTTPTATIAPKATNKNMKTGTTIVLSAGHCSATQEDYEAMSRQCCAFAAKSFMFKCATTGLFNNKASFAKSAFTDDLLSKAGVKTNAKNRESKGLTLLAKYGMVKKVKKGYGSTFSLEPEKWYEKYHSKFETFMKLVNKCRTKTGEIHDWVEKHKNSSSSTPCTSYKDATSNSSGVYFFKAKATSGSSYPDEHIPEYTINYDIVKALESALTKKGYSVVISRTGKATTSLADGSSFSNANMSKFASKQQGAVLHYVIHWDQSTGTEKGFHLYTPGDGIVPASVAKKSKTVADAMYNKKSFAKKVERSNGYTTLDWATIPTIIVECGWLTKGDVGRYVKNSKFQAKTWVKSNIDVFIDGIKAVGK